MKHTSEKWLALLLAVVMVLCLIPSAAFAEGTGIGRKARDEIPGETPQATGYIPAIIPGTRSVSDAYARGDMETYYQLTGRTPKRDTLPSSYDSRNYNYITSVKNQGSYGSCWAHAAMASIESYMIKFGVPVGTGAAATTSLNLSETQHCFFNYSSSYDAEGMLTGDKTTLKGSDGCLDAGGNGEMSAYTLQRWTGAADESVSALAYGKAGTVAKSGLDSQYAYGSNIAHVQNSEWIPATDIEGVKRAIMQYGAGNISYYAGSSNYTYNCTIDTSSQDSSSHKWANHAITVVGWDDSIAASKFSPNKPSGNGAWLCKNSWGTSYFNQGYMYISYEDTSVLEGYIYFYDAEPIDNYDHNYQYDGTCNPVCYGKGWPSSADYYVGFANNTKVANVFTAKGSELLKAVALCNWDEALSYTVEIYKNPTAGNPSSGTRMSTQSGMLTYSGYYTIVLDTPVLLNAGDTFSVVFTQSCPTADDEGKYIHTPYDATFSNTSVVSWASWTHANHGNTSYYQEPNGAWTDCPDNGDYRIKAYTVDYEETYTITAVSNNTSYGTVSVTGNVITATPKTGYYVESADVISGTASVTVNGNTVTVSAQSDCTVRVNFAPKPLYTVNFVAAGNAEGSETAYVNDSITLPSSVSVTPDGWTFVGWTAAHLDETTDAPAYDAPGASYTVTGSVTLYAVYSREEQSTGANVYELVTAAPSDWAGNYVISNGETSSMYVLKGVTPSSNGAQIENSSNASVFASSGIALTGTTLTGVANDYVFTLEAQGSYYSLKSVSTGAYIGMTSSSYLAGYTSYNSAYCNWTPAVNTSHAAQLKNAANGSYPYLSYSTSNSYFWSGSSGNANVLRLWKEAGGTTVYYATDPAAAVHEHTMNRTPAVEPTCTEPGNIEYWTCAECGKYFSDAEGNTEITLADTVIAALGHDYTATVTAPTCTEQGYTTHTCTRCGDSYVDTYVAALGHSYNTWTSNDNGTHSHVCSVCGDTVTENCTYNDVVTAPTATEQGYTTHTCTVCGYSYVDSYTDPLGESFTVRFSVPNGVAPIADMSCKEGESITLPTAGAPEGYTFLGWVTEDVVNASAQPEALTGTYAPTADITLKALYAHTVTAAAGYQLVTEAPESWEGRYVITYGRTDALIALKGVAGTKKLESAGAGAAAAFADTGMTLDGMTLVDAADAYVFEIAANGDKLTIRNAATGTYLASRGGYLYSYKTDTASYCRWTLAANGEAVDAANVSSKTLSHLGFSAKNYFAMSRTADANICFWKMGESTETTLYTTVID